MNALKITHRTKLLTKINILKLVKDTSNNITAAVKTVLEGRLPIHGTGKEYLISKSTLAHQVKHHKASDAKEFIYKQNNDVKKVFTNDEEE